MEWRIYDQDIQAVEELLLPHGAHFPEDAREVIRCWHSTYGKALPPSAAAAKSADAANLVFRCDRHLLHALPLTQFQ